MVERCQVCYTDCAGWLCQPAFPLLFVTFPQNDCPFCRNFEKKYPLIHCHLKLISYFCTVRRIVGNAEVRPMNVTDDAQADEIVRNGYTSVTHFLFSIIVTDN